VLKSRKSAEGYAHHSPFVQDKQATTIHANVDSKMISLDLGCYGKMLQS